MKFKKLFVIISLCVGLAAGGLIRFSKTHPVFGKTDTLCVLIDAGHGEPDGGAVGASGTIEKDINLSIAMKTGEILDSRGVNVIYTRTDDNAIYSDGADSIHDKKVSDMKNRRKLMESSGADLFISIHMNSFGDPSANGLHIFYSAQHEQLRPLAELIQDKIASVTGAKTHAVKTVSEKLFLMKNPPIPCILAECGFLSNPDEEKRLNDEEYQSKIAWAIADAIILMPDTKDNTG